MLTPLAGSLGPLGRAAGGLLYQLREQFTTARAAPLPSPRTCEPGPGTLTVQNAAFCSISSGALQLASDISAKGVFSNSLAHAAGRAYLWDVVAIGTRVDATLGAGFNSTSIGAADTIGNIRVPGGQSLPALPGGLGTYILIRSATGRLYYLFAASSLGSSTLGWISTEISTAAAVWSVFVAGISGWSGTVGDLRIVDLPAPWTTDFGPASSSSASSSAGQTATAQADALVEHTIIAATGVTQELWVRRTDASNGWIVRLSQSGSTIKLIQVQAGVETEQSSAAQTWTNGTAYRVVVVAVGATIQTYVATTPKNTYSSASFNQTATGVLVSHAGANLVCWPRTVTLPTI